MTRTPAQCRRTWLILPGSHPVRVSSGLQNTVGALLGWGAPGQWAEFDPDDAAPQHVDVECVWRDSASLPPPVQVGSERLLAAAEQPGRSLVRRLALGPGRCRLRIERVGRADGREGGLVDVILRPSSESSP